MTQSVTIKEDGNAVVTKRNDMITIDGTVENVTIPVSKGNDTIKFETVGSASDLRLTQTENSKDLVISYTHEDKDKTVTIKNYFTSTAGNSTKSSVKTIMVGDETLNITDLYKYAGVLTPKKGAVTGTVFSDEVTSTSANETFTLKTGHNVINIDASQPFGNDVINLTKNENLTIKISNFDGMPTASVVGKDLLVSFKDGDTSIGSVRLKNYASKDIVGSNGSIMVEMGDMKYDLIKQGLTFPNTDFVLDMPLFNWTADNVNSKGVLNGNRFNENIDVSGYENAKGKGVTINAGAGNDNIVGSKYNDKITGGAGTKSA